MECSEKQSSNKYTREALFRLQVKAPDEKIRRQVQENWDRVSKPLDGLGKFEKLIAGIGAIAGTPRIDISRKAVVIMCADNGIVEEGVSQSGQEITKVVAEGMAQRDTSVGKMASVIGADTIPVDIGINCREPIEGVVQKKIRCGTRNFKREPAMTEEEAIHAIFVGIQMAADCKAKGYHMIATGEMGIGNTTTSSAVAAALLQCEAGEMTGRGAGLDDEGLARKCRVIEEAVAHYGLRDADALKVLATVGGLDIAGLVGVCMGGALYHIPIVLDGVISLVAALVAEELLPGCREFLIASHKGKEPAMPRILKRLGLDPVIDGELALGEGTGAVMMMALLDVALAVYHGGTTFEDMAIERYKRFS